MANEQQDISYRLKLAQNTAYDSLQTNDMKSSCLTVRSMIVCAFAALLIPRIAFAYVDPGIVAMLYQALYVLVFGAVAAFVIRPWSYLKSLFRKSTKDDEGLKSEESSDTAKPVPDRRQSED